MDHLCSISDDSWEKLQRIPEIVKRLIKDYVQLNMNTVGSSLEHQSNDPYKSSKATLFADIHRVRRYFYYKINMIDSIPYLSRTAVDLAIEEVKNTYDDDGNILINIQNYLRTFCLKNQSESEEVRQQKKAKWEEKLNELIVKRPSNNKTIRQLKETTEQLEKDVKIYERRKENKSSYTSERELAERMKAKLNEKTNSDVDRMRKNNEVKKMKADYENEKKEANDKFEQSQNKYKQKNEEYLDLVAKTASEEQEIKHLDKLVKMDWKKQEEKLKVKYGRGLLLFGPPGTGK